MLNAILIVFRRILPVKYLFDSINDTKKNNETFFLLEFTHNPSFHDIFLPIPSKNVPNSVNISRKKGRMYAKASIIVGPQGAINE
jgi:hypothetical protein